MKKVILIIVPIAIILIFAIVASMFYFGVIQINNPSKSKYQVRGVDVSSYQGEIDWDILSKQNLDFAFIKATEGSSYVDEYFSSNWENASKTNLRIGAYHFFSFESAGKTQAENFCKVVYDTKNMLPPVVDVEPYGAYKELNDNTKEKMTKELLDWLSIVEDKYGIKPIIYTTEYYYNNWIKDSFKSYDLWFRSVYKSPSKDVDWKIWQYSNRTRLKGYNGEEKYIDMNVFNGSIEDFESYGKSKD